MGRRLGLHLAAVLDSEHRPALVDAGWHTSDAIDAGRSLGLCLDALFNDEENADHLFALKLAVFELENIKDSQEENLKKQIEDS